MNVNALAPDSRLLQSLVRTVEAVFPYTYVVKTSGYIYMLPGSPDSPPTDAWPRRLTPTGRPSDGKLPTDHHASTEMLTDAMIFGYTGNLTQ